MSLENFGDQAMRRASACIHSKGDSDMAATTSAPLPAAWSRILEQIETALSSSLSQVAEPAKMPSFANPALCLAAPEQNASWPKALATAEASAAASEAELARAEQMLRDWLAAVRASRAHLEETGMGRIR
jgi:hypothetical protein